MKNNVKATILLAFAAILLIGVVVSGVLAIIGIIPKDKIWIPFIAFIGGDVILITPLLIALEKMDEEYGVTRWNIKEENRADTSSRLKRITS